MNKMKKWIIVYILLAVLGSILCAEKDAPELGDGTSQNPYQISTDSNISWLMSDSTLWNKHFIQVSDIDIQETTPSQQPIGNESSPFSGTYDGQNHIITGINIYKPDSEGVGFFGIISGENSKLISLGLENCEVSGNKSVGGLVGVLSDYSQVIDCFTRGVVSSLSDNNAGGLVGKVTSQSQVKNSYSAASVSSQFNNIGGLVGLCEDSSSISNCYSLGYVSGGERVGGLVGRNREESIISYCYSKGSVSSQTDEYINGLVGRNQASVMHSFFDNQTSNCTNNNAGIGLTTDEMKQGSSFEQWDIIGTWVWNNNINEGYPHLSWQTYGTLPDYPEVWTLQPVQFSHEAGFYSDEFDLILTNDETTSSIIYTLDGSEPDLNNLNGTTYRYKNDYPSNPGDPYGEFLEGSYTSLQYSEPVHIYNRSSEENEISIIATTHHNSDSETPNEPIEKIFVIKARAFINDDIKSVITTKSYIIRESGFNNRELPLISISVNESELFDYVEGIYTAGRYLDIWRMRYPDDTAGGWSWGNYHLNGIDTEKKAFIEFWDEGSISPDLVQNIGIRIHGGASRSNAEKSLRLYARSEYGKSKFNYPFFKDYPYDEFKRLILRAGGNDFTATMLRDGVAQKIAENLNFETQKYRPSIVFINGEYWGIHNIRERYDGKYIDRKYNTGDNIDIITNHVIVSSGTIDAYNELLDYLTINKPLNEANYNYLCEVIDIDNTIDYLAVELYARNHDWPTNNLKLWRYNTSSPSLKTVFDGRWRFLLYDLDCGYRWVNANNLGADNSFETLFNKSEEDVGSLMFRRLIEYPEFQEKFIKRYLWLLDTTFKPERGLDILSQYKSIIDPEIENHLNRWKTPINSAEWVENLNIIETFINDRPAITLHHLKGFFDLDDEVSLSFINNNPAMGTIEINSYKIDESTDGYENKSLPWTGTYIQNQTIKIEAVPNPGYKFLHWNSSLDTLQVKNFLVTDDISLTAYFAQSAPDVVEPDITSSQLFSAYPNPFNPTTSINFNIDQDETGLLTIYNVKGELVREFKPYASGAHKVIWDGSNNHQKQVSSGIYLYRLKTGNYSKTRKMLIVK